MAPAVPMVVMLLMVVVVVVGVVASRPRPRPRPRHGPGADRHRHRVVVPPLAADVGGHGALAAAGLGAGADDPPDEEDAEDGADHDAGDGTAAEARVGCAAYGSGGLGFDENCCGRVLAGEEAAEAKGESAGW
ncbi:hypothetical protein BT67DRAFT_443543 [Trichocladium antarcticum]|uniref:Uncharacterized protein n=1 Tax=Trichocladium antarcticum TaxID=1450529 RepID=A0AAN6UH00_9PEZI|nr:hypothetical protein BT67DRAFT_443543 [Trichocladium antarcticum]